MKLIFLFSNFIIFLFLFSCSKNAEKSPPLSKFLKGELATVAKARGLTSNDLISAVKTYGPSGSREEYLAFYGTGVSGRMVVMGMPSMKILKYVAVFSSEAWQGFSYDDESKVILGNSSRGEIEYTYGDMGTPALSLTNGQHDGKYVFLADGANGRVGLVDLAEYETKQVLTNPLFHNSSPDLSISSNSTYVAQASGRPQFLNGEKKTLISGVTFWRFIVKKGEDHDSFFIDPNSSFSVLIPPAPLSSPVMGRGANSEFLLSVSQGERPYLNVINWKKAQSLLGKKTKSLNGHFAFDNEVAVQAGVLTRYELVKGMDRVLISGDGNFAVITNSTDSTIGLYKMKELLAGTSPVPIKVGGPSIDAAFTDKNLYVTVNNPNQIVKISLLDRKIKSTHKLDFPVGKILIPEGETSEGIDRYAVVTNHLPYDRLSTRVGPQLGLSAHLLDLREGEIKSLYDASIPQSTRLSAVAMSTKVNKPIHHYKIGTNPRTGLISDYRTFSGKEKIVRNGKRVHVYMTVIRSNITPDTIEVEQGDTVTIHITSNEQSKDNTHGFTIDSYNVHGSFEPGKTASLTFIADRVGVFPFYCTEFCSALHLEMQGYLLVKPMSDPKKVNFSKLSKLRNNPKMKSFFNYIKGEAL